MHGALLHGSEPAVVQALVDGGVDVSKLPWLHYVQRPDAARVLIAAGANARARTLHWASTPLHAALELLDIASPHVPALLRVFVEAGGADVDALNVSGETPLNAALTAMPQPAAAVEALLELGAVPSAGGSSGCACTMPAAYRPELRLRLCAS